MGFIFDSLCHITEKIIHIRDTYWQVYKGLLIEEFDYFFDDAKFKRYFENVTGPLIYRSHVENGIACCAFCSHLVQSSCHRYCFRCSKQVYVSCSPLLPGVFPFSVNYPDSGDDCSKPWIFQTPCTGYERVIKPNYFRNFMSLNRSIIIANYEALEGLFTGICRGKRPCHICACVSMEIYNECKEKGIESIPCHKVAKAITEKYKVMSGMIKYME